MHKEENLLMNFVAGKQVPTGGLHLIGTPDTEKIVESVRKKVQELLNLAHINAEYPSTRQEVTSEIIPTYKKFACGETISTLTQSVRGKHAYFFSDPSGDYKEDIKLTKDEIIKKLNNFLESNNPELETYEQENNFSATEIMLFKLVLELLNKSSLNDKLIHDLFTLSAIKTHGAKTINLVQACMPYARQDDMTPKKRQAASLEFIGKIISSITGVDGYVITADIHNNSAARGIFSSTNFINLYTGWFIEECIKYIGEENIILSPADQGGDKKIRAIAKEQKLENIIVVKSRNYAKEQNSENGNVENIDIYGDIEGKDVLIHDDMLDTGGTMCTLLRKMLEKKPRSINIAITHGMFNKQAINKLTEVIKESNGVIQNVYMTNSINKKGLPDYIKQIDLSNILANNILRKFKGLGIERNDNIDYTKIYSKKNV